MRTAPAGARSSVLPVVLAAIPLIWLVLVPLCVLIVSAFKPTGLIRDPGFTLDHVVGTYSSGEFWQLVLTTVIFAVGATVLALIQGGALAWLIERTDLPGRRLARALVILPMATPPFLLAICWILLLSPRTGTINVLLKSALGLAEAPFNIYSLTGMILVESLSLVPSAFLILAPALRNIDPSLEEAALVSGAGPWRLFVRVILPLLMPVLLGAALFLMIVSFVVFDIPGTIGMPARIFVLSSRVYSMITESARGIPEYGPVSAMTLLFVVALLALAWLYRRLLRQASRYVTVTGKGYRPRAFRLGRMRGLAAVAVVGYFLCSVILPLGVLAWTSFMPFPMQPSLAALKAATLANHADFFSNPFIGAASWHSAVIAIAASSVVAILALATSWVAVKSKAPGRGLVDALTFLPLAMPGVLIATALIAVYLWARFLPIYGTVWIIAVAYVTIYLSFGARTMSGVMVQLHPELEEAARVNGAGWLRMMRRVVVPLTLPALGAVWVWVFAHCLRELTAALLLQGTDNATLPAVLYSYASTGQNTKAAAVGVWLIVAVVAVMAIWQVAQRAAGVRASRAQAGEVV